MEYHWAKMASRAMKKQKKTAESFSSCGWISDAITSVMVESPTAAEMVQGIDSTVISSGPAEHFQPSLAPDATVAPEGEDVTGAAGDDTLIVEEDDDDDYCSSPADAIFSLLSFALSVYAAYLSWSCNSLGGMSTPLKVVNAFFAFLFGTLYIVLFVIFRTKECGSLLGLKQ